MIDLHTHSTASDGTFSPEKLVAEAHKTGLSVLALTDHDTVTGVKEAVEAGKRYGLHVLPGIEISVEWQPGELHLLGLGIDPESEKLHDFIAYVQRKRIERNHRIIEKFKTEGIFIDEKRLADIAEGAIIGRPHFAQYLIQEKKAKDMHDAFQKYLAKGRPFYIERESISFVEAVAAVKTANGVPVLAHPMSLYLSWSKLPDAIAQFKNEGLIGLEAWHSGARYAECIRLQELAGRLGLIVTAGSDFHGANRKNVSLGKTAHNMPIENRFYTENLLPALIAAGSPFALNTIC